MLSREFYARSTLTVAKELLGKFLARPGRVAMITETEAYCGVNDLACHSAKGRTPRTEVMFGPAGIAYIYLIYGMYYCLNIVTRGVGQAEAVLIRGVASASGPGRVARHFEITRALNGEDMTTSSRLWVEDRGIVIPRSRILHTPRIGVEYAGEYKDKKWRFVIKSER